MNQEEMFVRVGELAGRVGYPMPTLNWVEGVDGEDCVRFQGSRQGPGVITVHDHVSEHGTEQELDLTIMQALVRARVGAFWYPRSLRVVRWVVLLAAWLAVMVVSRQMEPFLLRWLLAVAVAFGASTVVNTAMGAVWTRRVNRRADRALVEVAGRQQVVDWLTPHATHGISARHRLRWLLRGAPPTAAARLRMLGEKA